MSAFMIGLVLILNHFVLDFPTEEARRRPEQAPCVSGCFHVVADDPVLDCPAVLLFLNSGIIMSQDE